MALPSKRGLPSLDSLPPIEEDFAIEENFSPVEKEIYSNEEEFIPVNDNFEEDDSVPLTDLDFEEDEDFINPYTEQEDNVEYEDNDEYDYYEEDSNASAKSSFNFSLIKEKLPKINLKKIFEKKDKSEISKKKNNKKEKSELSFNPKLIIGIITGVIILLFVLLKLFGGSSSKAPDISKIVEYEFVKEESDGVVFEVSSKENTIVNIQRIFLDKNNRYILCETGPQEVYKEKQRMTLFARCTNDVEPVKNTTKNLVKDNIVKEK